MDFSRFSSASFADLARLLCRRQLNGPVRVEVDDEATGLDGSFGKFGRGSGIPRVLVAFRNPSGDASADEAWLAEYVRSQFEPLLVADSEPELADDYVLFTNLRVAPDGEEPGVVSAALQAYHDTLQFRGWQIWDEAEILRRLEVEDEVSRIFAAWLRPTDPLGGVAADLPLRHTDFAGVLHRFLQKEMRAQRATRLQQAGHGGGDAATHLEDVFVDLPFQEASRYESEEDDLLLARLLRQTDRKLNPGRAASGDGPLPERLLLLGGPGQGKSTVSQLFAQILRASLLKAETSRPLSAEVRSAVNSVLDRTAEIGLFDRQARRFPLRIELPVFADALAGAAVAGARLSLIGHIRDHIAETADASDLTVDDLRTWLGGYPSVLLLDGLDEVPPSANRSEVIAAINDLWDDVAGFDADILMLVTTRPQGYNDDLDPKLYSRLEMTRLQTEHALGYAAKLAQRLVLEPAQQQRLLERMTEAATAPTTARLLVSPLQVAIMLALIDRRGEAPDDRWTLFESYFNVVLEREQQKTGAAGRTVKRWSRTIGSLHQAIGFALHLQAETGGGSDAQLSRAALEALVKDELVLDGYEGETLTAALAELLEATTDRLVLLVQRVEGRYSFEVRSLQEYMAAAYLMSGPEAQVQSRLREIADKSHWRHVFQIAASKCFSANDARHYRDTILQICRELNTENPADVALGSGARLALTLVEDQLAFDTPSSKRQLLLQALELVRADPVSELGNLMSAARADPITAAAVLEPHMRSGVARTRFGAWRLTLSLAVEDAWAAAMAEANWPDDLDLQLEILSLGLLPPARSSLHALMRQTLEAASIDRVAGHLTTNEFTSGDTALSKFAEEFDHLRLLSGLPRDNTTKIRVELAGSGTPLSFHILSLDMPPALRSAFLAAPLGGGWEIARAIGAFHENPSAAALAGTLRGLTRDTLKLARERFTHFIVWPLRAPLEMVWSGEDLEVVAARAEAGAFGDTIVWREAERRWSEAPLREADLEALFTRGYSPELAAVGAPYPARIVLAHGVEGRPTWCEVLLAMQPEAVPWAQGFLSWLLDFSLANYPLPGELGPEAARCLLEGYGGSWLRAKVLTSLSTESQSDPKVLALLEAKGRAGQIWANAEHRRRQSEIQSLIDQVAGRPELLPVLLNALGADVRRTPAVAEAAILALAHPDARVASAANAAAIIATGGALGSVEPVAAEPPPLFALGHLLETVHMPNGFENPTALDLCLAMVEAVRDRQSDGYERALSALARFADQRRSNLGDPAQIKELGLRASLCRVPVEVDT